jgi:ABC-type lipoprotein export system ATPase subunit
MRGSSEAAIEGAAGAELGSRHAARTEPQVATRGADVLLRGVSKRYGRITAVRDIELHVGAGEFVLVTGRSGSGKSTLLNLIGGLETPDAGQVMIDGRQVWRGGHLPQYRRTLVGFVFQHDLLLPALSARANVEVPLIGAGVGRRERTRRALELLDEVALSDRAEHRPDQLSGGERQRVAVARALVNEPRLLLADEPTGALDTTTSARLLDLLFGVRERHRTTMIMVSYDPLVGKRADRTLRMVDGRLEGAIESNDPRGDAQAQASGTPAEPGSARAASTG